MLKVQPDRIRGDKVLLWGDGSPSLLGSDRLNSIFLLNPDHPAISVSHLRKPRPMACKNHRFA
jgi:hypothetical protein